MAKGKLFVDHSDRVIGPVVVPAMLRQLWLPQAAAAVTHVTVSKDVGAGLNVLFEQRHEALNRLVPYRVNDCNLCFAANHPKNPSNHRLPTHSWESFTADLAFVDFNSTPKCQVWVYFLLDKVRAGISEEVLILSHHGCWKASHCKSVGNFGCNIVPLTHAPECQRYV